MAKEKFIDHNFRRSSLETIAKANKILEDFHRVGYTMTLRQLYYQFVRRNWIKNKDTEYDNLGKVVSNGRLAGLIDWSMMEDRLRSLDDLNNFADPPEAINWLADYVYHEHVWDSQDKRVEVWIEKDALLGVIKPICHKLRLPHFACRGYASQSAQYEAGKRIFNDARRLKRRTLILHLGDHDPSGIDMTRDNRDRLRMFSDTKLGSLVDVKRLALNMDQIEQYNPPPNPTKETDGRSGAYISEYGESCWELDALDPDVISKLIEDEVRPMINKKKWKAAMDAEAASKDRLRNAATWLEEE